MTWKLVALLTAVVVAIAGGLTLFFLRCKIFGCRSSGLASTTFYSNSGDPYLDQGKDSACGCNVGRPDANILSDWYNAATNDTLYGVDSHKPRTQWNCGSGCGKCYRLTTTGRRSDNTKWSNVPDSNVGINVVTTNFCPAADNPEWCAPKGKRVGINKKYAYHFDLQMSNELAQSWPGCNGDKCNAEVTFQEIACPEQVRAAMKENCVGGSVKC